MTPVGSDILQVQSLESDDRLVVFTLYVSRRVRFNLNTDPLPPDLNGSALIEALLKRRAVLNDAVGDDGRFIPAKQIFDGRGRFLEGESYLDDRYEGVVDQPEIDRRTDIYRREASVPQNLRGYIMAGASPV